MGKGPVWFARSWVARHFVSLTFARNAGWSESFVQHNAESEFVWKSEVNINRCDQFVQNNNESGNKFDVCLIVAIGLEFVSTTLFIVVELWWLIDNAQKWDVFIIRKKTNFWIELISKKKKKNKSKYHPEQKAPSPRAAPLWNFNFT